MSQTLRDDEVEVEVAVDVALLSGAPQGGRSPTGGAPDSSAAPSARASTEVVPPTARRRQFSPAYKRRMVRAAEACKDQPGAIGRLLRREGLYSSHLTHWRVEIAAAEEAALAPKVRGPKPDPARAEIKRIAELEGENARLKRKLGVSVRPTHLDARPRDVTGRSSRASRHPDRRASPSVGG